MRGLLALAGALVLVSLSTPLPADADTELFREQGWVVDGAMDTGPNVHSISVHVRGELAGEFSELKIYRVSAAGTPQVFSVKGSGALRAVLPPPGEFGGTFYPTGYWDCDPEVGFAQNMNITKLDIRVDPNDPDVLQLKGRASNGVSLVARNLVLRLFPATRRSMRVKVSYTLVASSDLCVDGTRQDAHEGFRVARIASNFISDDVHDSDQAGYVPIGGDIVCVDLRNEDGFVFEDPARLAEPRLFLVHSDGAPRETPTLVIKAIRPPPGELTPQGYVTGSSDANDDNVDLWVNWDEAEAEYAAGDTLGRFVYVLQAIPPGNLQCGG